MRSLWWMAAGACAALACSLNPQPLPPYTPTEPSVEGPGNVEAGTPQTVGGGATADAATTSDSAPPNGGLSNKSDSGSANDSPGAGGDGGTGVDGQTAQPPHGDGGSDGGVTDATRDSAEAGEEPDAPSEASATTAED